MKTRGLIAIAGLSFGLLAFHPFIVRDGGLQGKINPATGAERVLAVSGRDTLTAVINNGSFSIINVKKGTYTVWFKAKAPFKDTSIVNVAVIDSAITNLGEIKLLQ